MGEVKRLRVAGRKAKLDVSIAALRLRLALGAGLLKRLDGNLAGNWTKIRPVLDSSSVL
jgi:hypothetical protein